MDRALNGLNWQNISSFSNMILTSVFTNTGVKNGVVLTFGDIIDHGHHGEIDCQSKTQQDCPNTLDDESDDVNHHECDHLKEKNPQSIDQSFRGDEHVSYVTSILFIISNHFFRSRETNINRN